MRPRYFIALASGALAAGALAAAGAPPAAVAAGTVVRDTSGGTVGTVARVEGDHLIVRTDKHEVKLPASSFTAKDGALLFAMSRAQLNAAAERRKAEAQARIAPGAQVKDAGGVAVGTIAAVDAGSVTLTLPSGASLRLPRSAVSAGADGVATRMGVAELEAAAKAKGDS